MTLEMKYTNEFLEEICEILINCFPEVTSSVMICVKISTEDKDEKTILVFQEHTEKGENDIFHLFEKQELNNIENDICYKSINLREKNLYLCSYLNAGKVDDSRKKEKQREKNLEWFVFYSFQMDKKYKFIWEFWQIMLEELSKKIYDISLFYEKRDICRHIFRDIDKNKLILIFMKKMLSKYRLPNENTFTYLSSLKYEKAMNFSRMLFLESEPVYNLKFLQEDDILLNMDNQRLIRKLMEMNPKEYQLCVLFQDAEYKIRGLIEKSQKFENIEKAYFVEFEGEYVWKLCEKDSENKENEICSYRKGIYQLPYISETQEKYEKDIDKIDFIESEIKNKIKAVISELKKVCSHGMIFIFSDDTGQVKHFCSNNRGIKVKPFDINTKNIQLLNAVSMIDGAVYINLKGEVQAIGVILDGIIAKKGELGRGSRYNSTITYIDSRYKEKKSCFGIIISEDGMIDVYTGK